MKTHNVEIQFSLVILVNFIILLIGDRYITKTEEVGKNVAIAFAGYMATKGALKIAEVLGPLLVTYFINKRLITNAVNAAIGGGAAAAGGAAAGGAAAGAAGKTTWDIIKQKSRINAKKMMKGLKAAAKVARLFTLLI